MFDKHDWIVNAILVVAWAYIALYLCPHAVFLFTKTGGF